MLWEALAGRHPFWAPSLLATSKKIEAGAPPLEQPRPDLPKPLVGRDRPALHVDPMQRPGAAELAKTLRLVRRKPSSAKAPAPRPAAAPPLARVVPALARALFAGWAASALSVLSRRLADRCSRSWRRS